MNNETYEINICGVIHQTDSVRSASYGNGYGATKYRNRHSKMINEWRVGYVCNTIASNTVFDYGCGFGEFVKTMNKTGKEVYGYDPYYPEFDLGLKEILGLKKSEYCATFFDSLEHTEDPVGLLKFLNPSETIITLPCCPSKKIDEAFMNWKHRRHGEHLWHFNKESLVKTMRSINYEVRDISETESFFRKDNRYDPNIITGYFRRL